MNGIGQPVRLLLSPGQAGDAPRAEALLKGLRPQHVIADAAYDSDAIRATIRRNRGTACIRPNPTRLVKKRYDRHRYKHRHVIERFFGTIKRFRRVATRYEKKAENFLGFVWIASVIVSMNVHTT